MELALLVLLVVFACSILLVSSALMGKNQLQQREQQLRQQLVLDTMAENYLAGNLEDAPEYTQYAVFEKQGGNWQPLWTREGVPLPETDGDAVLVITDLSGKVLLTVACDENNTITCWSYG